MNTLKRIQIGDGWGYQDQTEHTVPPQSDCAYSFPEGLAAVRTGSKHGYINQSGKMIVEPKSDDAKGRYQGLAQVKIGRKWGYIDSTGEIESFNPNLRKLMISLRDWQQSSYQVSC